MCYVSNGTEIWSRQSDFYFTGYGEFINHPDFITVPDDEIVHPLHEKNVKVLLDFIYDQPEALKKYSTIRPHMSDFNHY